MLPHDTSSLHSTFMNWAGTRRSHQVPDGRCHHHNRNDEERKEQQAIGTSHRAIVTPPRSRPNFAHRVSRFSDRAFLARGILHGRRAQRILRFAQLEVDDAGRRNAIEGAGHGSSSLRRVGARRRVRDRRNGWGAGNGAAAAARADAGAVGTAGATRHARARPAARARRAAAARLRWPGRPAPPAPRARAGSTGAAGAAGNGVGGGGGSGGTVGAAGGSAGGGRGGTAGSGGRGGSAAGGGGRPAASEAGSCSRRCRAARARSSTSRALNGIVYAVGAFGTARGFAAPRRLRSRRPTPGRRRRSIPFSADHPNVAATADKLYILGEAGAQNSAEYDPAPTPGR